MSRIAFSGGFPPFRTASPAPDAPAHGLAPLIAGSLPGTSRRQGYALLGKDTHQPIGLAKRESPLLSVLDIFVGEHPVVLQHLEQLVVVVAASDRADFRGVDMKSLDQNQSSGSQRLPNFRQNGLREEIGEHDQIP